MRAVKKYLLQLFAFLIVAFNLSCFSNNGVEKSHQNGVETIINHIKPYRSSGEPSTFEMERLMTIDLEKEDLAIEGIADPGEFDVDAEGNIYIISFKSVKNFIYRFDRRGNLLNSFAGHGQGPGEIEWPLLNRVFADGRIAITDMMTDYNVFDKSGNLVHYLRPNIRISYVYPLDNGKLLVERPRYDLVISRGSPVPYTISLCDSSFIEIKELDRHQWYPGDKKLPSVFMFRVSGEHIYIFNEERGYEFLDYDFEGNLRRKIHKLYTPANVTKEIIRARLGPKYEQSGITHDDYFPNPLPPLASFFTDDEGRIFAMTYEAGDNPGEYIYDLFNANGLFIGRKSLDLGWAQFFPKISYAKIRNGCLYYYREKESGYNELFVQRVIWKK